MTFTSSIKEIREGLVDRKRILFFCTPATAYGGGQQYLYRIIEVLQKEGFGCLFVFKDFPYSKEFTGELEKRNAATMCIPANLFFIYDMLLLVNIIVQFRPHLIHINGYGDKTQKIVFICILFRPILKYKICLTQHLKLLSDSLAEFLSSNKYNLLKHPLSSLKWGMRQYFMTRFLLTKLNKVIFVNKIYFELYTDLLGLDKKRTISIINGVDYHKFKPDCLSSKEKMTLRKEFNFSSKEFVIIGLGNLIPQKNFVLFIDIIKHLTHKGIDIKGLIVGEGPLKDSLKKHAAQKGIDNKIVFSGYRSDIPELMVISDCMLMTSVDEGLPYAILEAKACALTVIAVSVGGIAEIINHKKDGFILNKNGYLEDAFIYINQLVKSKPLRNELGNNARQDIINRFGIDGMQRKTLNTFKNLCKKR